jgi:predicted HicB family RNase H-like nuclease
MTQGDTFEELGEMIQDAMRMWIETALEDGVDIPEPRLEEEYSGKFIVRVPKSLHRELVATAEREGVSLNMYVATVLGKAVGDPSFSGSAEPFLYGLRTSKREEPQTVRESSKAKRK